MLHCILKVVLIQFEFAIDVLVLDLLNNAILCRKTFVQYCILNVTSYYYFFFCCSLKGDECSFDQIFQEANFKTYIFKIRAKMETYNVKAFLKNLGTTRTYCIAVFVIAFHSNVFVTYISSISSWWLFGNFQKYILLCASVHAKSSKGRGNRKNKILWFTFHQFGKRSFKFKHLI